MYHVSLPTTVSGTNEIFKTTIAPRSSGLPVKRWHPLQITSGQYISRYKVASEEPGRLDEMEEQ
jgi:hypothetical protein